MGAQKMSSSELNNMLLKDNNTLQDINNKISNIKEDMSTKMTIIGHEMAYSSSLLNNYKAGLLTNDKTLIALSRSSNTQFTTYGPVAHSAFIKEPVNVFNLKVSGTGEYFFRNDITVAVNGLISEKYRDVLKHDSLPKEVFFNEYTSPNVTITLTAAEISQKLGPTVFNMVELDSFLNGSYDIKSFKVYKLNEDGTYNATPDEYSISSAGKLRFILPAKVSFYKIEIDITIKYHVTKNDTEVYPFGLKHIYLYNADFSADSFAVLAINSDKQFDSIQDVITILTPFGYKDTTATEQQIKFYIDYTKGVFDTPVNVSTTNQLNIISRNINTLYAKIPLNNKQLMGIKFNYTTR